MGYIGRHLVEYLVTNLDGSNITVADKSHKDLVGLHPIHEILIDQVRLIQVDLTKNPERAFD